ncbi:MAG: Hemerythrin cation binding domain [Deltaproteobacteria bacterium]|jgi:DUF438 domain-containing protein|nr:Hemerythrin cation binding domain [Deltaproteobacteria bacterium]
MQRTVEFSEIQRQHKELMRLITHLQTTATEASTTVSAEQRRAALQDEVAQLRASLVEHFQMEEEGGYLEAATAAGQGHSVARLQRQHEEILDALRRVADACRGGALDEATAGARNVISRLREHEAEECRLMQNAITDDIGVGD